MNTERELLDRVPDAWLWTHKYSGEKSLHFTDMLDSDFNRERWEWEPLYLTSPPATAVNTAEGVDEDMANIGRAFMEKLPKDYSWCECPTEYVTELQNQLFDASSPPASASMSAGVTDLLDRCSDLVRLVEGPLCERWQSIDGCRLKDTSEWVAFYNTVKDAGNAT